MAIYGYSLTPKRRVGRSIRLAGAGIGPLVRRVHLVHAGAGEIVKFMCVGVQHIACANGAGRGGRDRGWCGFRFRFGRRF